MSRTASSAKRVRLVLWWLLTLLYAGLAWQGLSGGVHDVFVGTTPGQQLTAGTQLLFGAFAAAAVVARFLATAWAFRLAVGWGVAATLTAATAPVTFGGAGVLPALGSGLAGAAVVAVVLWLDHGSRDGFRPG